MGIACFIAVLSVLGILSYNRVGCLSTPNRRVKVFSSPPLFHRGNNCMVDYDEKTKLRLPRWSKSHCGYRDGGGGVPLTGSTEITVRKRAAANSCQSMMVPYRLPSIHYALPPPPSLVCYRRWSVIAVAKAFFATAAWALWQKTKSGLPP